VKSGPAPVAPNSERIALKEFNGTTVLITGAAGGIGGATARLFGAHGARVVVSDIAADAAEKTAAAVSEAGGEGVTMPADVSEPVQVDALFDRIFRDFGQLHHAVNCAGIDAEMTLAPEWRLDVFRRVFDVNVQSIFCCMGREIEHMRAAGSGTIVNLSSVLGFQGSATKPIYSASKHAVMGLTRAAGLQYGRFGIRINAICPGATRTGMIMPSIEGIPGGEAMMSAALPIGRMAESDEVAKAIMFLSSDAASYMSGSALLFDGGLTAGMPPWPDGAA
jgi:NAD(P)-dependent dehydrogenase (short-subunit alcohol dehydrogenase family)